MTTQFDELALAYERSMSVLPFRQHIEMHSFLSAVGDVRGLRVLDLGCGSGFYARELARRGAASVTGVDCSEGMLDYARRRNESDKLAIDYIQADAMAPSSIIDDSLANRYDLVVSVYVAPYADSETRLASLCENAFNALSSSGQRFIALVLNPAFAQAAGWYDRYGFSLALEGAREDGAPVRMNAMVMEHRFDVTAYYWSRQTHERALDRAGFHSADWIRPDVSDEGKRAVEPTFWFNYLESPHALILDAATP